MNRLIFVLIAICGAVGFHLRLRAAQPEALHPRAGLPAVVKRAELNPSAPVFIPVHPRIATTITFPKPIGEPVGTGFIDADALQKAAAEGKPIGARGEYAITYTQGESRFTVQPLPKSDLLNLNVPYEGMTVVLYFYVVDKPLSAVASLTFFERGQKGSAEVPTRAGSASAEVTSDGAAGANEHIHHVDTPPTSPFKVATPARLEGFLRKLRLVHAARTGAELDDLCAAMGLKVAVSSVEDASATDIAQPVNPGRGYELILLRVARDPSLDAVGFVVLFRNTSDRELVFDLRTLSARCGAALYTAQVVDAPAKLRPGEIKAGYFVIVGSGDGRPGYLLPNNDWRLSVSVVSASDAAQTDAKAPLSAGKKASP